jgi:hypothetical protein
VSIDREDDGGCQAPPQIIEQSRDVRHEIVRFFPKNAARNVTGGVEEQVDVYQHHHGAQSSGWSQKMGEMMGDLEHLLN